MDKPSQSFDVCVVCALPEEVRAFLEVARTQCEGAIEERSSLRYHYSYRFATIKNQKGEPLSLHISWLPRYGPQEMTLHLSRILEECQPRIALMTGICAGHAQRVQLGDLVVAERTFTYDNGKFTIDEQGRSVHEHDTMTYQLDANIMQFLGLFKDWKPLVEGLERPPSPPEIKLNRHEVRSHVKAMASVSAVRADNPFEDVRAPVRGTVAIDMEGAAFGLVMSRHPLIPWLVVKGVCDYADRDKNDSYHDYAARASALYALSFIRAYVTNERLPRPDVSFLPKERAGMAQNDWGDAPDVPVFFGRTKELIVLEQWIVEDRCRLVALVGMKGIGKTRLSVKLGRGGIGKTDLSLKLARGIEAQFDYVIWRSLLNAPKLSELLTDLVKFLSDQREVVLPDVVSEQISRLLHYLRKSRCLVILDNAEMLLQGGKQVGQYHPGYQEYGQLFEQVAEVPHQSCLLLTSREKMPEIARLESRTGPVRLLEVRGLDYSDGKKIFAEIGSFSGSKEDWKRLNSFYNGNPLALQLAAHHIKEVFFGSISDFLREGKPIFADLQGLLDWHFDRLSDGHKEVMYWFTINREPTSLSELREDIPSQVGKEQIASTLQSLQRLIPLEKSPKSFTLQPVLMEYMTQRFVERVVEEVKNGKIYLSNTHALLKTSVSDYVRDVQRRLILKSMSEKLLRIYGNQGGLEGKLREILSLLRERFRFTPGYAGGNVLNLLCYLKVDLRGYNFSSLTVWQAYLRGVNLREVNFACADLATSVFTDTFGSILSVAFSPQGDLLAAGTATGEIRLWFAASRLPLQTLWGHVNWVWSVAFSPDGRTLASGSNDQTVRLWEASSGTCLATLQGHTNSVYSVAFSPDSRTLASGSNDQTVRLWEISSGTCLTTLQGHTNRVESVAFSPDGRILASGSEDQSVHLWEVSNGQYLATLQGHANLVSSVAFSPDGRTLASGSDDQTVRLWEASSGRCLTTLHGYAGAVYSVAFSPDGGILASGSVEQTVRLWEASSGRRLATLQGHINEVYSVAFSPDSRTLASGSYDQTVRLWEASSGQCLATLQGHTNWVRSVAFSPDGRTLASGSEDQTVRLWEASSGTCLATLQGHTNPVYSVAFSPDSRTLASGSNDQTVRLWEVSSGQCLATLQGHGHWVRSVAFSPDGRTLASGGYDGTTKLWDIQTGACLHTLRSDRPYERMDITQAKGLTEAQKVTLRSLGAIESA